jgi:hypothetical protein
LFPSVSFQEALNRHLTNQTTNRKQKRSHLQHFDVLTFKMFSKLLLSTLFAVAPMISLAEQQACADSDLVVQSITIGTYETGLPSGPPGSASLFTTATADVYSCAINANAPNKPPLVILIPGADAGKAEYSMAAKAFVDRGYAAAVLEEPITLGFFTAYLASPRSLKFFIDIVTVDDDFPADTDQIMLAGHSFGGGTVLYYLNGICPPPLCAPGVPGQSFFTPSDKIVAAGAWATSLIRRNRDNTISWNDGLNNADVPFFIINGQYDQRNYDFIEGEPVIDGTLSRLNPFRGLATIVGLDHYSIVNDLVPDGAAFNNYQDSTMSRESQVDAAVGALDTWFGTATQDNKLCRACHDLFANARESKNPLTRCEFEEGEKLLQRRNLRQ